MNFDITEGNYVSMPEISRPSVSCVIVIQTDSKTIYANPEDNIIAELLIASLSRDPMDITIECGKASLTCGYTEETGTLDTKPGDMILQNDGTLIFALDDEQKTGTKIGHISSITNEEKSILSGAETKARLSAEWGE